MLMLLLILQLGSKIKGAWTNLCGLCIIAVLLCLLCAQIVGLDGFILVVSSLRNQCVHLPIVISEENVLFGKKLVFVVQ